MGIKLRSPFYFGADVIAQPASASQAAVATTAITTAAVTTTTGAYGFATTTQLNNAMTILAACRTLVNQLRSDLVTLGLIKGSA